MRCDFIKVAVLSKKQGEHMDKTIIPRIFKEQRISWLLFLVFSFLVLSIIPFYRYQHYESWPSGEIAYTHMRFGKLFLNNEISTVDSGIVTPTLYVFDPFDVLIGIVGKTIGFHNAALFLPFLLGYLTILILYKILQKVLLSPGQHLLAGIFILTSPVFLTLFSEATNLALISFLVVAGFFFFIQPGKQWFVCFIFFFFLIFYPIEHLVIVIFLILSVHSISGKKKRGLFVVLFLSVGILYTFLTKTTTLLWNLSSLLFFIQSFFSDLGGKYGFSIFGVFLALLGFFYFFQQKKKSQWFLITFIIISIFIISISPIYGIYLIPFMGVAANYGFFSLLRREWNLASLQNITLFLLLLGILFSATSVISRNATAEPTYEEIAALLWLKDNSYENAIILTSEKYSAVSAAVSERRVLLGRNTITNQQNAALLEELHTLYFTRRIDTALPILEKYQIDYIVIFSEMKEGLIWDRHDEGLLFILKNGKNFKKVFENNKVTIWSIYY